MEDDSSPLIGCVVFLVLLFLDILVNGFRSALGNLSGSQVEERLENGSKGAKWLKSVMEDPERTLPSFQLLLIFLSIIAGVVPGRQYGRMLACAIMPEGPSSWLLVVCFLLVSFFAGFLLVVFGMLVPQKVAARKPEQWAFGLVWPMYALLLVFRPFGWLADLCADFVMRLCGMDPHAAVDDVTEEEIISMVKEGHEQGVIMANEAEMIHNIFEFGDKEAKDIMTHRKNMVALDAHTKLTEALEFMLEKNNSRFPVYEGDIDNIIGIVHIKDAMIQSRDARLLQRELCEIQNLVREVDFIPETRKIDSLFQSMQSKKNHMVIVVDEYGQTAGLVAMEDILEEIVGNILDEYDEEDTMIIAQGDGSFLMKGMAPLDEVCKELHLECDLSDYDTLNGYLISLIDKIPGDHEQFEVARDGYLFQALSVENKMIQAVKVTPLPDEAVPAEDEPEEASEKPSEEGHGGKDEEMACHDNESMI